MTTTTWHEEDPKALHRIGTGEVRRLSGFGDPDGQGGYPMYRAEIHVDDEDGRQRALQEVILATFAGDQATLLQACIHAVQAGAQVQWHVRWTPAPDADTRLDGVDWDTSLAVLLAITIKRSDTTTA
jgi:hypothetical protein